MAEVISFPTPGSIPGIPGVYGPGVYSIDYGVRDVFFLFATPPGDSLMTSEITITDIKSFGAVGNGSNDDTAAIQAAITAAQALNTGSFNSVGGAVYVPPGTYKITATLNISWPVAFFGSGWGSIIQLAAGSNCDMFAFTPTASNWMNGVRFSYLKLDGNGNNQTSGGHIINGKGAVWCLFDHVWFRTPWGSGLYLHDDNLGGFGHHNMVDHCFFDNGKNSNGGDGRGVYITNCDENMVVNCTFQDCGRAAAAEPNAYFETSGLNSVIGCQFVTGASGVKLQGARSKVIGCTFDGCGNHNIRLNGANNTVANNLFYNLGATGAGSADGIWVDNVSGSHIIGNTFVVYNGTNISRSFVNLSSGPATNTQIEANNMDNNGGGTLGAAKINVSTGTGHCIRNNKGYNPIGSVSAPGMPASTTPLTNNTGYDCMVLVTGGTVTQIAIGGTNTGQTSGWFRLPATQTVTMTYSSAPSWQWYAD